VPLTVAAADESPRTELLPHATATKETTATSETSFATLEIPELTKFVLTSPEAYRRSGRQPSRKRRRRESHQT